MWSASSRSCTSASVLIVVDVDDAGIVCDLHDVYEIGGLMQRILQVASVVSKRVVQALV